MNYIIKPMQTVDEIDGKGYVHYKSWQETYSGLIDPEYLKNTTEEKCKVMAYKWTDNILVAKDGDKVIGFVAYGKYREKTLSDCGEIFAIYVLAKYYGQKVGYELMNAAFEKLADYKKIAVWVLKGNERAIKFYERYGFRFDGTEQEIMLGTPNTELRMMYEKIMKIEFENIILRDMIESDIEDYVRWFTTETEWSNTDAPWEPIESDEETERTSWREYYESVKDIPDDVRRWKFEIEWNGRHIGWVSSYPIDENYEWIGEIKDGQTVYRAIGIDVCEPDVWGKGVGTNALRAFINYYFENGVDQLYTQTWSGNVRMLRCAEKLGFVECNRNIGIRDVDGQKYDGLTFRWER